MHNRLRPFPAPPLKLHGVLKHRRLDLLRQSAPCLLRLQKFPRKREENHISSDSFSEQLIKFGSDLPQISGALFSDRVCGNLGDESFIVGPRNWRVFPYAGLLEFESLQHHDRFADIAPRVDCDLGRHLTRQVELLLHGDFLEQLGQDLLARGRNSDLEATGLEGGDHLGEGLAVGDDAAGGHVGLHGAAEGGLRGLSELIEFVDDNHFKGFLLFGVELLAACDFFDELLDDDSVVLVGFAGGDFDVVEGSEHDAGASGRGG